MKRFYPFFFITLFAVWVGPLGGVGHASSSSSSSLVDEEGKKTTPIPVSKGDVFGLNSDGSLGSNVPRFLDLDKTKPYGDRAFLLFPIKNERGSVYPIGLYDVKEDESINVYRLFTQTLPNLSLDLEIPLPAGFTGPKTVGEALNGALTARSLDPIDGYESIKSILTRLEGARRSASSS